MYEINVSKQIKKYRELAGLKQKDVYGKLGIAQSTYSSWEVGKAEPDATMIGKLCKIFDITANTFFEYDKWKPVEESKLPTNDEQILIENYRRLDTHGRTAVDLILNEEIKRIDAEELRKLEHQKKKAKVKQFPMHDYKEPERVTKKIYDEPAAAGKGNYLYAEEETYEEKEFPAEDVPYNADFGIRIRGKSMEPKIKDGSIVWVEEKIQIESGEIGIFILDERSLCKKLRIDYDKGEVVLVSLNSDYDDILVEPEQDLRTVGKVLI